MDEYDVYEDIYFGRIKEQNASKRIKLTGIYEFINHLNPPESIPSVHIPYRVLIQQVGLFNNQAIAGNIELQVLERLKKYGLIKDQNFSDTILLNKISLAMNWVTDNIDSDEIGNDQSENRLSLSDEQRLIIKEIVSDLEILESKSIKQHSDGVIQVDNEVLSQEVQSIIFNYAKKHGFQPKEVFKLFYNLLINADRGPRLGNYIVDLGLSNVVRTLHQKTS